MLYLDVSLATQTSLIAYFSLSCHQSLRVLLSFSLLSWSLSLPETNLLHLCFYFPISLFDFTLSMALSFWSNLITYFHLSLSNSIFPSIVFSQFLSLCLCHSITLVWQRWPWLVEHSEVNLDLLKAAHTPQDFKRGHKGCLVLDEAVHGQSQISTNWVETRWLNDSTAKFKCSAINMLWN